MSQFAKAAIEQLENLIAKWESVATHRGDFGSFKTDSVLFVRIKDSILRLAPKDSAHHSACQNTPELMELGHIAKALRDDYADGYLSNIEEMVHGALFADFLEAAEHLLDQGYKDAAAVMTGGVLETHLRQLCVKHGVAMASSSGSPKKAETLNTELRASGAYDLGVQKHVTSMLDLRNSAAHANYSDYDSARVKLYIAEVRQFLGANPA